MRDTGVDPGFSEGGGGGGGLGEGRVRERVCASSRAKQGSFCH